MDLNQDGIQDVISGSVGGELYIIRGLGKGQYAGPRTIQFRNANGGGEPISPTTPAPKEKEFGPKDFVEGRNIKFGLVATPAAVDWNHDGHLDLLVGSDEVPMMLVPGVGKMSFGEPIPILAGGKKIELGYAAPSVADWDGDGIVDLLVGTKHGAVWFFKAGKPGPDGMPRLAEGISLIANYKRPESQSARPQPRSVKHAIVQAVDWNGDGSLDLLVGDRDTTTVQVIPDERLSEKQKQHRQSLRENDKKIRAIDRGHRARLRLQAMRDLELDDKADLTDKMLSQIKKRTSELYKGDPAFRANLKKLKVCSWDLRTYEKLGGTGHVWVYLRKGKDD